MIQFSAVGVSASATAGVTAGVNAGAAAAILETKARGGWIQSWIYAASILGKLIKMFLLQLSISRV